MAAVSQSTVLLSLALVGGLAQFAIGIRLYEPPDDYGADSSAIEAGVFFVAFSLVFGAVGFGLASLERVVPPLGRVAVLLVGAVGVYSFYSTALGEREATRSEAARAMGAVTGVVIAGLSVVVLLL